MRDSAPVIPEPALRALFEQSPFSTVVYDRAGRIVATNAAFERLFGVTRDMIPPDYSVLNDPELERGGHLALVRRAFAGEAAVLPLVRYDAAHLVGAESTTWTQGHFFPVRDERGELTAVALVHVDLTGRVEAEETRRREDAALRRAVELHSEQMEQQAVEMELQQVELESHAEELRAANLALAAATRDTQRALQEAQEAGGFVRGILASIADPFVVYDADWRFRFVNDAAVAAFASAAPASQGEIVGRVLWEAYPDLVGTRFEREMRRSREEQVPTSFAEFRAATGHSAEVRCYPMEGGALAVMWRDVTDARRAEEARHYLAGVAEILAGSLDREEIASRLAHLLVPKLADWCSIQLVDEAGALKQVAVAHHDPSKVVWARDLADRYPSDPTATTGTHEVVRSGQPKLYATITDQMLVAMAVDAEHLRLLRELGFASALTVPLVARGRAIGALTLIAAESGRRYGDAELHLAEEIATRAGLAVDNARLFSLATEARQRAEESARHTVRLQTLTAALGNATTESEVAEILMRHGVLAMGAYAGVLAEPTADGSAVELLSCVGYPAEACMHVGRRWPADAPIPIAEAVRTGSLVLVESPDDWAHRYPRSYDPAAPVRPPAPPGASRAWAAYPLLGDAGVRGALLWTFAEPRAFTDEDRGFMAAVAYQGAQALERARLRDAERAARAEAEEANRAKSDFLARMSHDLRTPLNAIGGYAQLLEEGIYGDLGSESRMPLARIRRAQQHLLALINDVLSFAKLEAGQVSVRPVPVPVQELVDALRPLIEQQMTAHGLRFEVAPIPGDAIVRADRERATQILLNLVGNAMKFTDAGGRVVVSCATHADTVSVTVTDSGRGIPADRLDAIFAPFVQLGSAAEDSRQGVGLGLSIGRELARMMDGTLSATSVLGEGSAFVLTLPRVTGG